MHTVYKVTPMDFDKMTVCKFLFQFHQSASEYTCTFGCDDEAVFALCFNVQNMWNGKGIKGKGRNKQLENVDRFVLMGWGRAGWEESLWFRSKSR